MDSAIFVSVICSCGSEESYSIVRGVGNRAAKGINEYYK
jgi:hypothetical protein